MQGERFKGKNPIKKKKKKKEGWGSKQMFKISTHLAWIHLYCANICESHEYSPLHAALWKEEELSMTYVKVMESSSSFSNSMWTSQPRPHLNRPFNLKKKAFHWHIFQTFHLQQRYP
jgi:hypothetical protein